MGLQGYWEEVTTGMTILVEGYEVDFHDGRGRRQLEERAKGVTLKRLTLEGGLPDLAYWRHEKGMSMVWSRAPHVAADPGFQARFHRYKMSRVVLRSQLIKAVDEEDWEAAAAIQATWESTWGGTKDTTPEEELRLSRGRFLVPGACVRHKIFNYRAVILGCEPFVRAPVARIWSERERSSAGGADFYRFSPVYCCLIDDRDAPGGGVTYVPEAELEFCPAFYPLQSRFAEALFEAKDGIRGYMPTMALKQALQLQGDGLPFRLQM